MKRANELRTRVADEAEGACTEHDADDQELMRGLAQASVNELYSIMSFFAQELSDACSVRSCGALPSAVAADDGVKHCKPEAKPSPGADSCAESKHGIGSGAVPGSGAHFANSSEIFPDMCVEMGGAESFVEDERQNTDTTPTSHNTQYTMRNAERICHDNATEYSSQKSKEHTMRQSLGLQVFDYGINQNVDIPYLVASYVNAKPLMKDS